MFEIFAAVIGAAGAVAAALVARKSGEKKGKILALQEARAEIHKRTEKIQQEKGKLALEKGKIELEVSQNAKAFQEHLCERFGVKVDSIKCVMNVQNSEGDASVNREWRGIKPNPGISISHIPGYFWVGTPGGSIEKGPYLSVDPQFNKNVSLVETERTETRSKFRIEVVGGFDTGDTGLNFDVGVGYRKVVLMTSEEVSSAYRNDDFPLDYFSFDVEWPLDQLDLEVTFPENSGFKIYPGVFFGWTELMHKQELKRTQTGFTKTARGGRYTVPHPLVGLRYVLYWSPPE